MIAQDGSVRGGLRLAGKACVWAAFVVSCLALARYVFGLDFGMAPASAGGFLLLGAAVLLPGRARREDLAAAQILAGSAGLMGLLTALSWGYGARMPFGMTPYAAAAIAAAALGVLAIRPDRGLMAVVAGDRVGGQLARRILPAVVGLPIMLGWLYLRATSSGSLENAFGAAFMVSAFIGAIGALVVLIAASLNRLEAGRASGDRRYRSILSNTLEGFCGTDADGRILEVNEAFCRMHGYSRTELLAMNVADIEAAESPAQTQEHLERIVRVGNECFETRHRCKNGALIDVEISVQTVGAGEGGLIAFCREIGNRKRAEAELRLLQTGIEQAGESVLITDADGAILFVNPAFEEATGFSRREVLGKNPRILKSGKQDVRFYREMWETISSGRVWKGRIINKRKDGSLQTADSTISPVRDAAGRVINYVSVKRDVTEHIQLESELRQSQKMESIGRLAGGVAHDFNNLLTAINGYAEFVMAGLPKDDSKREDVKEILAASKRAESLTRQLLAFSRKQILNPQVLDINAVVGGTASMLKRLIGEDVKLETRLAARPCLAKVDAGQLEQVFLNLAVNARDAMPKGGTLTFETGIADASAEFASRNPGMPRGPLVRLSVRDTGCGMSDEVKERIFEPFFTTKEKGKGTGLGLSTVFGIIKQSGGEIEVDSEPGGGATFRIYFPQMEAAAPGKDRSKDKDGDGLVRGHEAVLFVEDEDIIRRLGERTLTANGYDVLSAASGPEALRALERRAKPVDLLVTDVVMFGMNGRELAQEVARRKMARRTLFISGYTDDAIVQHGVLEPGLSFLYKPFLPGALLRKLREVLDGPVDQAKA
ncbi:MAG: PAS domain S-box protein [Elusimicrobia bacterium]|nr:PAS domain S-box protein [Elusimicrobiota bacterium]